MKAIMLSIRPKWVAKILNGEKTIEIRKKFPKDFKGWVYIYCTKDGYLHLENNGKWSYSRNQKYTYIRSGKVVARFWCNNVEEIKFHCLTKPNTYGVQRIEAIFTTQTLSFTELKKLSCLTGDDLMKYLNTSYGYAIHISDFEIFDKPKELNEFKRPKWSKCEVKDKNGLYQCDKCPYGVHYSKVYYQCNYNKPIKAPQSWCYVEVEKLENGK